MQKGSWPKAGQDEKMVDKLVYRFEILGIEGSCSSNLTCKGYTVTGGGLVELTKLNQQLLVRDVF